MFASIDVLEQACLLLGVAVSHLQGLGRSDITGDSVC